MSRDSQVRAISGRVVSPALLIRKQVVDVVLPASGGHRTNQRPVVVDVWGSQASGIGSTGLRLHQGFSAQRSRCAGDRRGDGRATRWFGVLATASIHHLPERRDVPVCTCGPDSRLGPVRFAATERGHRRCRCFLLAHCTLTCPPRGTKKIHFLRGYRQSPLDRCGSDGPRRSSPVGIR